MTGIHPDLAGLAVSVDALESLPGNPRRGDVDAVARSYATFGQRKPIVARRQGNGGIVLAGNHQLAAARKLGWSEIAVVWVDDDDLAAKAFALADNRTADLGDYDDGLLAAMLAEVAVDADMLAASGFVASDLDALTGAKRTGLTDVDDVPEAPRTPTTVPGDVVLDLFGGSGSTLIACHALGRAGRLMELDPRYVDVICRRYQEHTGSLPVNEATGRDHDFVAESALVPA